MSESRAIRSRRTQRARGRVSPGRVVRSFLLLLAVMVLAVGIVTKERDFGRVGNFMRDWAVAIGVVPGCTIKGNISEIGGEKIYHVSGQAFYVATRIDPIAGERWFCSEAEARAAGWRRARQ